ncbi:MAG: hypothetical protein ACOY0T_06655 [Myxococcota bacterium]
MTRTTWLLVVGAALGLVLVWLWREKPEPATANISGSVAAPVASGSANSPASSRAVQYPELSLTAEPSAIYEQLATEPVWKGLIASGERFSLNYAHRPFGSLILEGARLTRADDSSYRVEAQKLWLNGVAFPGVTFTLRRTGEKVELRPELVGSQVKPIQVDYTPGRGGAIWLLTLPHQPARPALSHYGSPLVPDSEQPRMLASLSLVVLDAPDKPVSGRYEMVMDAWPRPGWPDSAALLGDAVSFAATVEPGADPARWALQQVRVSSLLFTLSGSGQLEWATMPKLHVEAKGDRTCAQLRANLGPSVYLDEITRFLDARGKREAGGKVELAVVVEVDSASGKHDISWKLSGGCGITPR